MKHARVAKKKKKKKKQKKNKQNCQKLRFKQRHNGITEKKMNATDETQESRNDNLMAMGALE